VRFASADDADDTDDPRLGFQKIVVLPPSSENFRMSKKQTIEIRRPRQAGHSSNPPSTEPSGPTLGSARRQSSHR
jgi:hypothetical protein